MIEKSVSSSRPIRKADVNWRSYMKGVLIEDGFALSLVGRMIWELCDGKHTVDDIVQKIRKEFDVGEADVEMDVIRFIEELKERKLLS